MVDAYTGKLKLEKDFGDWQFSKNWLIQVLLYVKKIFHLEQFFSLESHMEFVANREAHRQYTEDFEAFVDKCILCVEKSIDEKFAPERTRLQLSRPESNTDAIKDKLESFKDEGDDLAVKEKLKNYFKHNLPDQLKQKNPILNDESTSSQLPKMSMMTAI